MILAEKGSSRSCPCVPVISSGCDFSGVETMNDTAESAKQLRRIAEQLRNINPKSCDDVKRYLHVLTGRAASVIKPHWKLVAERTGLNASVDFFPNIGLHAPQADREEWAVAWVAIAVGLNRVTLGRIDFGMPVLSEVREADGSITHLMEVKLDDWRHIAEDSAGICEYLAGILESPSESESPQSQTVHKPDASRTQALPLGLQYCDVAQTLKRDGFKKPVTIKNEDHWKLMEALMAAFPNAVSEPKLNHIFQGPNDRDNYSRALKNSIDTLGLTVEKWVLTAMK
jgi:hypothetical protein